MKNETLSLLLLLAALVAPPGCASSAARPTARTLAPPSSGHRLASAPAGGPLVELNDLFRASYRAARERRLTRLGPVLLVSGDQLVLVRQERREAAAILSPEYHRLKAVAHVPLALWVLLADAAAPLAPDRRAALERLQELTGEVEAAFAAERDAAFAARQLDILRSCRTLVEHALGPEGIAPPELEAFARRVGPLLLENATDAARLQIDALHAAVTRFREQLGEDGWREVHVVVVGAHMARQDEVSMQYFQRALAEPFEGGRVIFAEGLWEEPAAFQLLATHRLDASAGEAFFADAMRMHRDVLADGARARLDEVLPAAR